MLFLKVLNKVVKAVVIADMGAITVVVAVEVFLRYFLGKTLYITEEFTRYAMVWMVFLGCSVAVAENCHNRVEIFVNYFPVCCRCWLNLLAKLLFCTFLVVLVTQGLIVLPFQADQTVPALNISILWFYLAIPVGGILMILNLLPRIWQDILIVLGKAEPVEEKVEVPSLEGGLS